MTDRYCTPFYSIPGHKLQYLHFSYVGGMKCNTQY